jgi:hypothetical protein
MRHLERGVGPGARCFRMPRQHREASGSRPSALRPTAFNGWTGIVRACAKARALGLRVIRAADRRKHGPGVRKIAEVERRKATRALRRCAKLKLVRRSALHPPSRGIRKGRNQSSGAKRLARIIRYART